jgi:competence protein ComEC
LRLRAARGHTGLLELIASERDRWALWIPVLLGLGIGLYFSLGQEPPLWSALVGPLALSALLAVLWALKRSGEYVFLFVQALLCLSLGFAAAKLRTEQFDAPVIEREIRNASIEGRIIGIKPGSDGFPRLIIKPTSISRLADDKLPRGLRLSYRGGQELLMPGTTVRFRATLMAPPGPVMPHGFDFARQSYFDGLGAVGYIISDLEAVEGDSARSAGSKVSLWIVRARGQLAKRIREGLPGDRGALAAALITGDRSGIPPDKVDALRNSGLAHLLAISGLHMGMAGYAIFGLVRMVLAAIPFLAMRYPIRKWAAAVGLAGATTYLIISGAPISAQRAFIMLAFVFLAILLDRPAFTLRTVALAAIFILLLQPESLMEAGFQMSFAACTVLVSAYEAKRKWVRGRPKRGSFVLGAGEPVNMAHWFGSKSVRYVGGIVLTTLLADMATAPFAVYHFNRFANLSLVANLGAVPFMGTLVMPPAVLALVAMPFGLEAWPLAVMGFGIDQILWVAESVSAKTYSISSVAAWPPAALFILVFGALWLLLWSKPWRLAGVAGIGAGLFIAMNASQPDLFIGRDGKNIAVLTDEGVLDIMKGRRSSYATDTWQRRAGAMPQKTGHGKTGDERGSEAPPFNCDRLGCVYHLADGRTLVHVSDSRAFFEDCRIADILVTNLYVPKTCIGPTLIIDKWDIRDGGAHAIRFLKGGDRVVTSQAVRGERPWSRGS